jgi:hypothetical protein
LLLILSQIHDYFICLIKYSRATSCVNRLSDEKTNVSKIISVLFFRVLMYLEKQSVADIGLPEFHTSLYLAWTVSPDTSVP